MQDGTAASAPDVELEALTKRFGDLVAVDAVDLEVARGEFLALLGPSGCGKTTTLRMVAGFEEPTAGEIRIGGEAVSGVPPYRRQVNTVFQQYALFPHLSVEDNVAYGLKQRRVGRAERRRQAHEALDLVRLRGRERSRPAELSGGQQQRVALARALVMRPRVLLLDEPLGALDQKLRKAMQIELKRIQEDVGITFVVVTHDQEEAMAMADRIAVMDQGRIEQLGSPSEVYDHPATPFVADFIGEMNHLTAPVERDESGHPVVVVGGARVGVAGVLGDVPAGARARVGLRPDEVHATVRGQGEPATVLTAMVLGHDVQVLARLADGTEVVARQPRTGSEAGLAALEPGAAVRLRFADAALVLGPADDDPAPRAVAPAGRPAAVSTS
jgi:spermidine/putrescine transport system ATP-binding protein